MVLSNHEERNWDRSRSLPVHRCALRTTLSPRDVQACLVKRLALAIVLAVLGAAALTTPPVEATTRYCIDRSYEDLRVANISCSVGKRVYRYSQRNCSGSPCRVTYAGRRWKCRARNTSFYTWRCTSGSRVVTYRWLAGE